MYYKFIFYTSLAMGTMVAISSYSWMGMWMGLEINLLSIIPLMSNTDNMMTSEASMKYFITQALASTILLFSIIIMSINFMYNLQLNLYFSLLLNTALLTKMGAAPFHFWFPEIMMGLSWINSTIMLTWQKIAPMILLIYSNKTLIYLSLSIITCMLISGIMGNNQTNLRKIMAYSSINHIGWMLASLMFMESIWLFYFIVYSIITLNITLIFNILNIFHLKQLFMFMNNNFMIKLFFILNFLSLSGLPPFLGFLPKWLTIQTMINYELMSLTFIMIISTLMTIFFYIQITYSTMILQMNEINFMILFKNSFLLMSTNLISLSGLILMTIMFNFI
uniref:NADH-ubiquinone oxidoreductase chain 2 n=1 Tax=Maladera orientalis TaxID=941252 RepID=A0A7T1M7Y1_9SCAR|nr:NADH dehydrogenase subunit 2 [Maladera orientalis]